MVNKKKKEYLDKQKQKQYELQKQKWEVGKKKYLDFVVAPPSCYEEDLREFFLSQRKQAVNDVSRLSACVVVSDMEIILDQSQRENEPKLITEGSTSSGKRGIKSDDVIYCHLAIMQTHFPSIFEVLEKGRITPTPTTNSKNNNEKNKDQIDSSGNTKKNKQKDDKKSGNAKTENSNNKKEEVKGEWEKWFGGFSGLGGSEERKKQVIEIFKRNKLTVGDAADFEHDLLKSVGIELAKERLEILKMV